MSTSVLVTGGAGFIGSHLCRSLVASGYAVTVLDDLSSGSAEHLSPSVRLVQASVLDKVAVRSLVEECDACIHLAAISSVARCNDEPTIAHAVNVTGFLNVLEAVRDIRPDCRLVYASSSAVYGGAQELPLAEEAAGWPSSSYGADKRACELYAEAFWKSFGVGSVGLRFFNVYGPGQDASSPYSGVISAFVRRATLGDPLVVNGSGRQTRDFVYVSDAVDSVMACLQAPLTGHEILNVCTGQETSVSSLAEAVIAATGGQGTVQYARVRQGDIERSFGDSSRLRRYLGQIGSVDLAAGLARTINAEQGKYRRASASGN